MRKRTARRARPTNPSNRGIGTLPWSYFVVVAICGCVIAAGFLLAARQHFMSMDLGMKNSKLRKQLEDLESEKRRLMLAREVAYSPMEITRTARSLGFVDTFDASTPIQIAVVASAAPSVKPVELLSRPVVKEDRVKPVQISLTRTAYQRPSTAHESRTVIPKKAVEKPISKSQPAKKAELTAVARIR